MLEEICEEIEQKCQRRVILCALQGSQNYNLDDENSDFDFKIFVEPNFDDFYFGNKISKTYETNYGKAEVKDIRLLVDLIKKMNPTYLEILATKHYLVLDDFFKQYFKMKKDLQLIIEERKPIFYKALFGTMKQEAQNLGNSKNVSHIFRLYNLVSKMQNNIDFADALTNDGVNRQNLINIKRNGIYDTKELNSILEKTSNIVDSVANKKISDTHIIESIQEPIREYLYERYINHSI